MEHRHAIIIIKNKEGKYLQYLDDRWNSYLFLNCKVKDESDILSVEKKVTESFNIKKDNIKIRYITDKIHSKFSQSAKIIKKYHHYFYTVDIGDIKVPDKFKWYTINELQKDKRIMETNSDIVGYVKDIENGEMNNNE